MEPIDFKQSNMKLTAPGSMPDCEDLPVYTDGKQCISCWKLSFKERIKILFTGRVWLDVIGHRTQPPVWVDVKKPFIEPNFFDHVRFAFYWLKDLPKSFRIGRADKESDKIMHYKAGATIGSIGVMLMCIINNAFDLGIGNIMYLIAGIAAGFAAGIAKELYDRITKKGTPEWADLWATWNGSLVGSIIMFVIDLLIDFVLRMF